MKLLELKQRVREVWESLNTWKDGVIMQPENFDKDVKSFGDRRYKKTWIQALARFKATKIHRSCLDAWTLITISFNYVPSRWDYEYRYEILDEFLRYPNGLELISIGLEQIFASDDFSPQEQKETRENGFLKLVEEQTGDNRGICFSIESTRTIAATRTAA
jgi:hypothetical protein